MNQNAAMTISVVNVKTVSNQLKGGHFQNDFLTYHRLHCGAISGSEAAEAKASV